MPPTREPTQTKRWSRDAVVITALAVLLVLVGLSRLLIGDQFGWPDQPGAFTLRLERLLIGLVVGSSLAVGGAILQALLRNPLASPYILGISSGAVLGVMTTTYLAAAGYLGGLSATALGLNHTGALIGALATMAVVYLLSQKRGFIDPMGLLLVGVVVNSINGAAIMFINYLVPHGLKADLVVWMMGYYNPDIMLHWPMWKLAFWQSPLIIVLILTIIGITIAACLGRSMDVATLSDDEAHAVGLNLPLLRMGLFGLAGLLTAGTVILAGPIGFIGLISPHLVRVLIGPNHRSLVIGSALTGAILIIGADVAVLLADFGQGLMPIGVLTALIGGPVFLWMLRPQLGRGVSQ